MMKRLTMAIGIFALLGLTGSTVANTHTLVTSEANHFRFVSDDEGMADSSQNATNGDDNQNADNDQDQNQNNATDQNQQADQDNDNNSDQQSNDSDTDYN